MTRKDDKAMDMNYRAKFAMECAMVSNPERTVRGCRDYFSVIPFPVPKAEHVQWDDGDGTARALDAWLFLRRMTGDRAAGKHVEEGQWAYLNSIIHPQTGLVYVSDLSPPNRDGYYYHMWDQGRTLRHLVHRFTLMDLDGKERDRVGSMILRMLESLKALSSETATADGKPAAYWKHELYVDGQPIDKSEALGYDIRGAWVVAGGQLIHPVVEYAVATASGNLLEWAVRIANGFVAGLERDRWGSASPMIGERGEFYGHFHCVAGGLTGLALLARELIRIGRSGEGNAFLHEAERAYGWVFSEDNPNRGGSHGWFPERTSPSAASRISEICCTADMIEFAAALASVSELGGEYVRYDGYWDDVDRYTRNHLCQSQILRPEKLLRWADPGAMENPGSINEVYDKLRGAWAVGQAWPHDLMDFETESGAYGKKRVQVWGCCSYSGPRGLYACWSHAVRSREREIDVRIPVGYQNSKIRVSEIESGGITFSVAGPAKVSVRIPRTADPDSVAVTAGGSATAAGHDRRANRMVLAAEPGLEYAVRWKWLSWESRETIGLPNKGHVPNSPLDQRVAYTLRYTGNTLVSMEPGEGAYLPYFEGL